MASISVSPNYKTIGIIQSLRQFILEKTIKKQTIAECIEYTKQRSVANAGKVNDGKDIGAIISHTRKTSTTSSKQHA